MKNALIVGGTSGLGFELAKLLTHYGYEITITGRNDPQVEDFSFVPLELSDMAWEDPFGALRQSPPFDLVVYAAGYLQDGVLSDLSVEDIWNMCIVGLLAPTLLLRHLVGVQGRVPGLIVITSTSAFVPRKREPVYTAVKAGLGMLANSLSLDADHFDKVLVVAPSGMQTPFWANSGRDVSGMLDPIEVASEILMQWTRKFSYRHVAVLREPLRVEVREECE